MKVFFLTFLVAGALCAQIPDRVEIFPSDGIPLTDQQIAEQVLKIVREQQVELDSVKKERDGLKTNLETAQNENKSAKTSIEATQKEINSLAADLEATKKKLWWWRLHFGIVLIVSVVGAAFIWGKKLLELAAGLYGRVRGV